MERFEVIVSGIEMLTPRVRSFVLARADGAPLPGWTAGAHIDVYAQAFDRRSYSLIETTARDAIEHPTAYRIAVLLEAKSRGGSAYMPHHHLPSFK
jgi:ferredoxin-NADP reductase